MSFSFDVFVGIVTVLLILLLSAFRTARRTASSRTTRPPEDCERQHVIYLPQIRQALAPADFTYLSAKAPSGLAQQVRKERRKIALLYLSALREDFRKLLRLARVIAVLSPEVSPMREFERLRLGIRFACNYEVIRLRLYWGLLPSPQLVKVSNMLSTLSVRMERAMQELGERAAFAAELASSLDRRRLDAS